MTPYEPYQERTRRHVEEYLRAGVTVVWEMAVLLFAIFGICAALVVASVATS